MTGTTFFRLAGSLAAIALLLVFVPLTSVVEAMRRLTPGAWLTTLLLFLAGHAMNAVKLRLLLGRTVPYAACLRAQYAGIAAGFGLPGLAGGDVVRGLYLAPRAGAGRVVAASLWDRAIDIVTLILLAAIALPFAGVPEPWRAAVPGAGWWLAGGLGCAVIGGAAVMRLRIGSIPEHIVVAAVISLGVQSAFVLSNLWIAREAGVMTGLAAWFVAWPLSKLVAVLPISLGGLGVREASLVLLLVPFGVSGDAVLASGILWQTIVVFAALVGFVLSQLASDDTVRI